MPIRRFVFFAFLVSLAASAQAGIHRGISGSQTRTYSYNTKGEITGDGTKSFTLNAKGQIQTITGLATYGYDGNGKRIKTVKGTTTEYALYDLAGHLVYSEQGTTKTDYLSLNGQTVVELKKTGSTTTATYLHPDLLGSPRKATDATGSIAWEEHYDPYGQKLNGVAEKIGYTGHAYDAESNLTYMEARFFDPLVGRFLSTDPVGFQDESPFTFNRYSYANNNPYKYTDPDGHSAVLAPEAFIGGTLVCGPVCGFVAAGAITIGGSYLGYKAVKVFNESQPPEGPRSLTDDEKGRLSGAGRADDKGGRTKAGRALQKHGNREGSAFPSATGTADDHNDQGQKVLDDILNDPGSTIETDDRGRTTVTAPDGRGAKFNPDGSMQGFREPPPPPPPPEPRAPK